MPIQFRCVQCARLLQSPDNTEGRQVRCPECGTIMTIPAPSAADDIPVTPEPVPPTDGLHPLGGNETLGAGGQTFSDSTGGFNSYSASAQNPAQTNQDAVIYALSRVAGPAMCLVITAILALCVQILGIVANILQIAGVFVLPQHNHQELPIIFTGPISIVFGVIGICLSILVLVGALKMKQLQSYGLAMAVSIIVMIPCVSPCCLLGLPFGIWAVVVLSDPIVKSAFRS